MTGVRNAGTGSHGGKQHVVVIGAGLVGVACALWLQRAGMGVTLVDRAEPGSGASFGNAGTFATYASAPVGTPEVIRGLPGMLFDPAGPLSIRWRYLPKLAGWLARFARHSTRAEVERISRALHLLLDRAHEGYAPLLRDIDSASLVRSKGCLYLFGTDAEFDAAAADLALKARRGVAVEVLGRDAVRQMEPAIAPVYAKAVYFPDATHTIDPGALTLDLADLFRRQGGRILCDSVERIEVVDGRATRAVTAGGDIRGDQFVLAAGAWSRTLAATLGDRVPLDTERGYHVMIPRRDVVARPVAWSRGGFYLTPMVEGLRVAGTVELAGLKRPPDPRRLRRLVAGARHLVPDLPEPVSEWMGFRPSMPDSLPVVGRSPTVANAIHAFGHGHLGLTLAGITGRIVADLAAGRAADPDIGAFAPDRFRRFRLG